MAFCGVCGLGALDVRTRSHGKQRVAFYRCRTNVQKGRAKCPNDAEMRMVEADRAVLQTVEEDVLRPEVVTAAIEAAIAQLQPGARQLDARHEALEQQVCRTDAECRRLAEAIRLGGDLPALVQEMKDAEARRAGLRRQLAELDGLAEVAQLDVPRLQRDLAARLTDWQGLLGRQPAQARQVLKKLLQGKLIFTPIEDGTGFVFEGKGTLEPVLAGVVGTGGPPSAKAGGSPWRFEPVTTR
jgi:Recombinase zinc beta ribbon domain